MDPTSPQELKHDDCCSSGGDSCAPPPLKFPEPASAPATAAECRGTVCGCHGGVPAFDGMDPRYRRILWTVIALNGVMFLTEMAAGQLAGSQALKADALDFLADTVTYGLSLAVIGATLRTRATAALFKGLSLSLMALWVLGSLGEERGFGCHPRRQPARRRCTIEVSRNVAKSSDRLVFDTV